MEKIEYRVRPVIRYMVTRFHESDGGLTGCSQPKGEFGNYRSAYDVAYALCKEEHGRLGWPLNDERIQYPREIMGIEDAERVLADVVAKPNAVMAAPSNYQLGHANAK